MSHQKTFGYFYYPMLLVTPAVITPRGQHCRCIWSFLQSRSQSSSCDLVNTANHVLVQPSQLHS